MDIDSNLPVGLGPRQLLEGTCSLTFEAQEFTAAGGGLTLWLRVPDEVRSELARRLGMNEARLRGPEQFHAKFMGRIACSGSGHGHFGCYAGMVVIDELIEARLLSGQGPELAADLFASG